MDAMLFQEMEELLRQHTQDHDTLAEFYEAVGYCRERAVQERLAQFRDYVQEKKYAVAVRYAKERGLHPSELQQVIRTWCQSVMEEWPAEALKIARGHNLTDLALEAAVRYSEYILQGKSDVSSALEIARRERADDEGFRRRAARHAYGYFIQGRRFSGLAALVSEFRSFFTPLEIELAQFLDRAEKECLDRKYGAPIGAR